MTPLRSQVGLNALNFRVGAIQTAFGPFFTVYLTQKGWDQVDIGFSLSVGTAAALIFQLPAGALIDAVHLKRIAIAAALLLIGLSPSSRIRRPKAVFLATGTRYQFDITGRYFAAKLKTTVVKTYPIPMP
jgi:MFS family permease